MPIVVDAIARINTDDINVVGELVWSWLVK